MDPSALQFPIDSAAPPEAPRGAEPAPGKRRGERSESTGTADAAAAALTVSFADILKSRRLDTGSAEGDGEKKPALPKAKTPGPDADGGPAVGAGRRLAAAGRPPRMPAVEVQAAETLEHARDLAGRAVKAAAHRAPGREPADAGKAAAPPANGTLSPSEDALLREIIRNNGTASAHRTAARMTRYVNGEPLNRREGINAVKSMTAKEGEVLKILSGDEGAPAQSKGKSAKPAKAPQAFAARGDAPEGSGKVPQTALQSDKAMQEPNGTSDPAPEKIAPAGQGKRQGGAVWTNPEPRDAPAGPSAMSALQGRGIDNPTPARPQALISQVLEGASQILRDGSGRMVLTLQPPRLGTLDLDVVVQDNRVRMVILADNQEVKQMLQAGMDDLRSALQDRGFEIDRLEVLVQNRPDEDGQGFWREAGFAGGNPRKKEEQQTGRDTDPAPPGAPARPIRTGDGGLSIFA